MRTWKGWPQRALLAVAVFVLINPLSLSATTIAEFSTADLVAFAELAGKVTILERTDNPGGTTYRLRIDDLLIGRALGDELSLTLDDTVVGMPSLEPGKSYVLFLNLTNRYERVIALIPGTLEERDGFLFDYFGSPVQLEEMNYRGTVRGNGEEGGVAVALPAHRYAPGAYPVSFAEFRSAVLRVRDDLIRAGASLRSR